MKERSGFTLLELLVALTITVLVISAVVFSFTSWVKVQERAELAIESQRGVEFAIKRMRETIGTSYAPFLADRQNFALFEGMDLERPNQPFDALSFGSLGHRTRRIDAKESELIDMTIFTLPDPELENGEQCRILKIREGGIINDRFEVEGGLVYELLRNLSRFQIFYLSPEAELKQEWKLPDTDYILPCAVIIWLGTGCQEEERVYCILVPLHLTNAEGCKFESEALSDVCEVQK